MESSNFTYSLMFALGFGLLLPWNVFLNSIPWLQSLYPSQSIAYWLAAIYNYPQLPMQFINVACAGKISSAARIIGGFSVQAAVLLITPIVATKAYAGVMILGGLSGLSVAILESAIFGFAGSLDGQGRYTQAVMSGEGVSAVGANVLQLTLMLLPSDRALLSDAYFIVSAVVMVCCAGCQLYLVRHHRRHGQNQKHLAGETRQPITASADSVDVGDDADSKQRGLLENEEDFDGVLIAERLASVGKQQDHGALASRDRSGSLEYSMYSLHVQEVIATSRSASRGPSACPSPAGHKLSESRHDYDSNHHQHRRTGSPFIQRRSGSIGGPAALHLDHNVRSSPLPTILSVSNLDRFQPINRNLSLNEDAEAGAPDSDIAAGRWAAPLTPPQDGLNRRPSERGDDIEMGQWYEPPGGAEIVDGASRGSISPSASDSSITLHGLAANWRRVKSVLAKTWSTAASITIAMIVSFLIFPGVTADIRYKDSLGTVPAFDGNSAWWTLLLITVNSVGDLCGRTLAAHVRIKSSNWILAYSLSRALIVPMILGCARNWMPGTALFGDVTALLSTLAMAVTNGHCASLAMMLAPSLAGPDDAEFAGFLQVVFLIFGLWLGAQVALLLTN